MPLSFLQFSCLLLAAAHCFAEIRVPIERRVRQRKFRNRLEHLYPDVKFVPLNISDNITINLIDYTEIFYVANVSLGTPPQTFQLTMDTGSSDLWVPGTSCGTECESCSGMGPICYPKLEFEPKNSSSYIQIGKNFSLEYQKGSCKGSVGMDAMTIGNKCVIKQLMGVSNSIGNEFKRQQMNGVFGLGFQGLANFTTPVPVLNMVTQGLIDKAIFSVWMERVGEYTPTEPHVGGEIVFGSNPDTSKYTGPIYYQTITSNTKWMINLHGYSVGSASETTTKYNNALPDTGTSFLVGPVSEIHAIATSLGYEGRHGNYYTMNCSMRDTAPDINLHFGGRAFAIPANDYLIDIDIGPGVCAIGIEGININDGVKWVLGDTWIRAWYHVFDMEKGRVGFAKAVRSDNAPTTTSTVPATTTKGASKSGSSVTATLVAQLVAVATFMKLWNKL